MPTTEYKIRRPQRSGSVEYHMEVVEEPGQVLKTIPSKFLSKSIKIHQNSSNFVQESKLNFVKYIIFVNLIRRGLVSDGGC